MKRAFILPLFISAMFFICTPSYMFGVSAQPHWSRSGTTLYTNVSMDSVELNGTFYGQASYIKNMYLSNSIFHRDDNDTYINFNVGGDIVEIYTGGKKTSFTESGGNLELDVDGSLSTDTLRVYESANFNDDIYLVNNTYMPSIYFRDDTAGADLYSVMTTQYGFYIRDVTHSKYPLIINNNVVNGAIRCRSTGVNINDNENNCDFVVHTINNEILFYINAGTDRIGVNDSTPDEGYIFDVNGNIQCTLLDETSDSRIKNVLFEIETKPNALRRFCDNLSMVMYNPIFYNETTLELDDNGSVVNWFLEFGDINTDFIEVGLIAQDVWDLCNNFSNNQSLNDKISRSVVHKPVNESKELWALNYRMISLLYMVNNKLRIRNVENFLINYGYDPDILY